MAEVTCFSWSGDLGLPNCLIWTHLDMLAKCSWYPCFVKFVSIWLDKLKVQQLFEKARGNWGREGREKAQLPGATGLVTGMVVEEWRIQNIWGILRPWFFSDEDVRRSRVHRSWSMSHIMMKVYLSDTGRNEHRRSRVMFSFSSFPYSIQILSPPQLNMWRGSSLSHCWRNMVLTSQSQKLS